MITTEKAACTGNVTASWGGHSEYRHCHNKNGICFLMTLGCVGSGVYACLCAHLCKYEYYVVFPVWLIRLVL